MRLTFCEKSELNIIAPSAERRAPSAERRAPSAERRAPSAERRAPSAERRAPSAERRAPSAERRAPSAERRAPSAERRAPSAERRAPSAERRAPSAERRAPSAERRAPSAERRGHDCAVGAGRPLRRPPREAPRLRVARHSVVGSARTLANAAWLAALGALALPATAQAQEIALVSNIGQAHNGYLNINPADFTLGTVQIGEQRGAQRFTTGSNPAGYTLQSVVLNLHINVGTGQVGWCR